MLLYIGMAFWGIIVGAGLYSTQRRYFDGVNSSPLCVLAYLGLVGFFGLLITMVLVYTQWTVIITIAGTGLGYGLCLLVQKTTKPDEPLYD